MTVATSMRSLLWTVLLCLTTLAQAASVEIDYDTNADFSGFTYYEFKATADNVDPEFAMLGSGNIQDALVPALEQSRVAASATHPADFLVSYQIRTAKKMVDDRPRVGVGIGGMGSNVGGGFSFSLPLGGDKFDTEAHVVSGFLDPVTQKLYGDARLHL